VFVLGLFAGALLSAAALLVVSGLLAPAPTGWRRTATVAVAFLGLLREAGIVRIPLPQNSRQVPLDVLQRGLVRGALQFGFELGTGVRTFVSASAPYVLACTVLLDGRPLTALLAGLGFGAGRAATPLVRLASGTAEWDVLLRERLRGITLGAAVAMLAAYALLL
jgi:hypothetical protein